MNKAYLVGKEEKMNIEKIIETSAPDADETWECFEGVMKESAKESGIKKKDFNDYCLLLSEDSDVWAIAAEISIKRLKKAVPLIIQEIFSNAVGASFETEGDTAGIIFSIEFLKSVDQYPVHITKPVGAK